MIAQQVPLTIHRPLPDDSELSIVGLTGLVAAAFDLDPTTIETVASRQRFAVSPRASHNDPTVMQEGVEAALLELDPRVAVVAFDLRHVQDLRAQPVVKPIVATLNRHMRSHVEIKVVLLMRHSEILGASSRVRLETGIETSRIRYCFLDGTVAGSTRTFDPGLLRPTVTTAGLRRDLDRRIIRRWGFYKPSRSIDEAPLRRLCFDLQRARHQARDLLAIRLGELRSDDAPFLKLVGHPEVTNWLEDPVADLVRAGLARRLGPSSSAKPSGADTVVVLTQFVETGNSLSRAADAIEREAQGQPSVQLWSLLADGRLQDAPGAEADSWNSVLLKSGRQCFYVLRVNQEMVAEQPPGATVSELGAEAYTTIPTVEFWRMVEQSGLIHEELDPTDGRSALRNVPDFSFMLDREGQWIVSKIVDALRPRGIVASEAVFVTPSKEEAASKLGSLLEDLYDSAVIYIPKEHIVRAGKLAGAGRPIRADEFQGESWATRLSSLDQYTPIVAIDEFSVSGTVVRGFANLASAFGLSLAQAVVLADFGPQPVHYQTLFVPLYSFRHSLVDV